MAALRVVVLTAVAGCSFVGARGADLPTRPDAVVECTDTNTLPALDVFATVLMTIPAAAAVIVPDRIDEPAALLLLGGVAIVAATGASSAIYGVTRVRSCRRAKRELARLRSTAGSTRP